MKAVKFEAVFVRDGMARSEIIEVLNRWGYMRWGRGFQEGLFVGIALTGLAFFYIMGCLHWPA